jgi:uncharacterized protein with PQ loop repeat
MGMEEETRDFLVLIVNTIALVLLWMIANVLAGIYFKLAFFSGHPGVWNIVYYVLSFGTLFIIIRHLKRKWGL